MSFYDIVSQVLTLIGYVVLVYRIVFELDSGKIKKSQLERLCTKMLIFTFFLKIEDYIFAVIEILPFGTLLLLFLKLLLFLPTNSFSHVIYKKIERQLEKVKLQDYNSHFGTALSYICTHTIIFMMRLIIQIVSFIDYQHIEEAEKSILEIIKVLEYKRSAVAIRSQVMGSAINEQLNATEFNVSMDSADQEPKPLQSPIKSAINSQMGKILSGIDEDEGDEVAKVKAEVMIAKPDKLLKKRAVYEEVVLEYYYSTAKLTITNAMMAVEQGTLKQVRWVTKNMLNIECILLEGKSKLIRFKDNGAITKWVEPVSISLKMRDSGQMGR